MSALAARFTILWHSNYVSTVRNDAQLNSTTLLIFCTFLYRTRHHTFSSYIYDEVNSVFVAAAHISLSSFYRNNLANFIDTVWQAIHCIAGFDSASF